MNTIEILVTCLALSLDCFVVMMARGAMMNPQEHRRSLINSLIFAGSSLLMIVLGSLAGSLIKSQLVLHVNQVIAALILFALGCFLLIQAFRQKAIEERHDDSFNYKKVLILGLITSVDVYLHLSLHQQDCHWMYAGSRQFSLSSILVFPTPPYDWPSFPGLPDFNAGHTGLCGVGTTDRLSAGTGLSPDDFHSRQRYSLFDQP